MGKGDSEQSSYALIPNELKPLYRSTAAQLMNLQASNPLAGPSAYWSAHGRKEYGAGLDEDYYAKMFSSPTYKYQHPDAGSPMMDNPVGWNEAGPSDVAPAKPAVGASAGGVSAGSGSIPPGVASGGAQKTAGITAKSGSVSGNNGGGTGATAGSGSGTPSFDEWLSSLPYSIPGSGALDAYNAIYGGKSAGGGMSLRDIASSNPMTAGSPSSVKKPSISVKQSKAKKQAKDGGRK